MLPTVFPLSSPASGPMRHGCTSIHICGNMLHVHAKVERESKEAEGDKAVLVVATSPDVLPYLCLPPYAIVFLLPQSRRNFTRLAAEKSNGGWRAFSILQFFQPCLSFLVLFWVRQKKEYIPRYLNKSPTHRRILHRVPLNRTKLVQAKPKRIKQFDCLRRKDRHEMYLAEAKHVPEAPYPAHLHAVRRKLSQLLLSNRNGKEERRREVLPTYSFQQ